MIRFFKQFDTTGDTTKNTPDTYGPTDGQLSGHDLEPLESRVLMSASLGPLGFEADSTRDAIIVDADPGTTPGTTPGDSDADVFQTSMRSAKGGPGGGGGGNGNGGGGSGGGGGGNGGGGSGGGTDRAVWVWGQETVDLINDPTTRGLSLDFFADKGVTTVYLYSAPIHLGDGMVHDPMTTNPDGFAGLVNDLHTAGIEVYGLIDSIVVDANAPIVDLFQDVLDYNDSRSLDSEKLVGMNFDIEPWVNPALDWETNREDLSRDYLDLSQQLVAKRDAQDPAMTLGVAMPFWFDTFSVDWNTQLTPMNQHVQSLYDYVSVMDFRDTATGPDGLIAHAQDEIDFANTIGKTVVIGVETNDVAPTPALEKITFFEEGEKEMDRQLSITAREFKNDASFGGFAIQDFAGYVALAGANVPLTSLGTLAPVTQATITDGDAANNDTDADFGQEADLLQIELDFVLA